MIVAAVLIVPLILAARPQTAPGADDLRQTVQALMDEKFKGIPSDRRLKYTEGLIASLSSVSSPERSATLLKELPGVMDYFATGAVLQQVIAPKKVLDPSTELGSYDLQASYLSAIVARAAAIQWTDDSKAEVFRQIDAISAAGKSALSEKLTGDGASELIDRTVDQNRRVWIASLESPFSCFIDRPLTPGQMGKVLEGIRSSTSENLPVAISRTEVNDLQKLTDSGAPALIGKVGAASWKARSICFSEMEAFERGSKEDQSQLEDRVVSHYRESAKEYLSDARAKLPASTVNKSAEPGSLSAADAKNPDEPKVISFPSLSQALPSPPIAHQAESNFTLRNAGIIILLTASGAFILWTMRGRKAAQRH